MVNNASKWEQKKLDQVMLDITNGTTQNQIDNPTAYPVTRIETISDGVIDLTRVKYLEEMNKNDLIKYRLKKGDILFSHINSIGHIGKTAYYDGIPETLIHGMNLLKLRPNSDVILPKYIFTITNYELFRNRVKSLAKKAINQASINQQEVGSIYLDVPPLVEQRGIVEVLGTVDECIRLTDAVIEKAEELKRGLMQQLLTRGIGHTEYKETPLGKIPKTWKISELGKIANLERGKFSHRPRNDPAFYGGNIPFIQTGDIADSNGYIRTFSQTLNEKGLSVSRLFPKGTIVISIAANIGDVGVITFDSCFPDSIVGVTPKNEIDHKYLLYLLRHYKERMNRESIISTQKNTNLKILNPMKVPTPSLEEQKMISKILYESDEKTNNEIKRREKLNKIKQGLMQSLLSGKIRVELKEDGLHRVEDSREAYN